MEAESKTGVFLSRRGFMKGLALGAAGAGVAMSIGCSPKNSDTSTSAGVAGSSSGDVPSFMIAPEPIDEAKITDTIDTQVLIVGAGIGGATAALSCVENGLDVVLIDKLEKPRSVGCDYGFVNAQPQIDAGLEPVDPYTLTRDHVAKRANRVDTSVVYRFMSRSGEAGDWFTAKAAEFGLYPEVQDYAGSSDFYKNYVHVIRYFPKENRPENIYDNLATILSGFAEKVVEAGSTFMPKTEAVQLSQSEDGSILGAICKTADEAYIKVNASKGVVLATGDYAGDSEMLAEYLEWDVDDIEMNESTGLGEGHKMGLWVGAQMQTAPHPMMLFHEAHVYHYLRVNKNGQRYVNEDAGYCGASAAQLRQPDHASWAIFDSKWPEEIPASTEFGGGMGWDQDGREINAPWVAEDEERDVFDYEREAGYMSEAETLEELADLMGLDSDAKSTFLSTVDRYNQLCETAVDEDFGKRSELMRLSSIKEPPFYAVRMITDLGVSVGGLINDVEGRLLDDDGKPIPGLYGIGNVTGSMFAVDYNEVTVPGISLARNITFGWLLGKHLAS